MRPGESITEQEWRRRKLALQSETLAREYLVCIHAAPDTETALWDALWHLSKKLGYDWAYVFEEMDRLHISNTCERLRAGISSEIDQLPYVEGKSLEPWYQEFADDGQIILENTGTIRYEGPLLYEFLTLQGICSIILDPLLTKRQMHGLLEADNLPAERLGHTSMLPEMLSNFTSRLAGQKGPKESRIRWLPCPQEPDAIRFRGKEVLLVDDSKEIPRINQRVLKSEGYGLLTTLTLQETGELLEKTAPDTVILNMDLPDSDGITSCQRLREVSDVPMIFLIDHAESSLKRGGLGAGGAVYLAGSYHITELQDAVAAAVS